MKLLKYLLSLFPTNLPVGVQEFDSWAQDIRMLVGKGFEQVLQDDFKYVLATNIMHLGPQKNKVSKNFFVKTLRKSAANQIAGQVFQDVKSRHDAVIAAQKAKEAETKQAEVTAQPAGASNAQTEDTSQNTH